MLCEWQGGKIVVGFCYLAILKYPIDTPEHVRAAWSYINHQDNAAKYDADEVELIKKRIKRAAEKHGIEIGEA